VSVKGRSVFQTTADPPASAYLPEGLKLSDLLKMNLRTVKACLLKEDFQRLWNFTYLHRTHIHHGTRP
jgi:hypothetical protein